MRWRWLLFAASVAAQLFVLYWPGQPGPAVFPYADKVVHIAVFGLTAFAGRWAGLRPLVVGGALVGHAVVSEVVQATVLPMRSGDPLDAVADVVGVGIGLAIAAAISGRAVGEQRPDTES